MIGGRQRTKQEKEKARALLIDKIMLGDIGTFYINKEYDKESPLVYLIPERFQPPQEEK